MTDIVERLRHIGRERQRTTAHIIPDHYLHVVAKISQADGKLMSEAADEITRLRAEVERLRAALKNLMGHVDTPIARRRLGITGEQPEWLVEARAALTTQQKDGDND